MVRTETVLALVLASACAEDPCSRVTCVEELPWSGPGSTEAAGEDLARYACGGPVLDGPEEVYRVVLTEEGFLATEATAAGTRPLHVMLLDALSEQACLDGGEARAGALLPAGEYHLVVDSEAGAAGDYQLRIGFTTAPDLEAQGIQRSAAEDALSVFDTAWRARESRRLDYVITDFSLHSSLERQWIFDLAGEELLFHLHVAHGRGFNEPFVETAYPPGFSNTPETHLSSLGLMISGEPYTGAYGSSHRIDGLEPDLNDNVRDRAIVMHPWEGSRPEFVASHGEVQPTWGCPALDDRVAPRVAERLSGGVLMFFWHPQWREQSHYLAP